MRMFFKDSHFSYELLRTMGYSVFGGSDIGECLETAGRIKEKDFNSWYREWLKTAERIEQIAKACLINGHKVSAREAFLRASNYYRTSEFYLHEVKWDERALAAYRKSKECFLMASELMDHGFERILIPYEGVNLPGYFLKPDVSAIKRPVLIINGGFDSTAEELYFVAIPALKRGFNCLVFDGPGQGAALREQRMYFRPDWENVITPVVDYLYTRNDVDRNKIAIIGYSFGGYLAPRAAAFENRIKALIANSGIYDYFEVGISRASSRNLILKELEKEKSPIIEFSNRIAKKFITAARWAISEGLWKFDAETTHQLLKKYKAYTMKGLAEKITCATLICDSENEKFFPGQAKQLFNSLRCDKSMLIFKKETGSEEHCQASSLLFAQQQIIDWLEEKLLCNS